MPARLRRAISQVAFGVALACIAWVMLLLVHGGFDTTILGIKVTSHDPWRPIWLAALALGVTTLAGGTGAPRAITDAWLRALERAARRGWDWPVAAMLAVGAASAGVVWNTYAAGGSDSYGYLRQAQLWLSGHLTITQPWVAKVPWPNAAWTFSPLAFRPATDGGTLVPTYSPGLPMLMALAMKVAGQCAAFWLSPLCGGVLVLATHAIGRKTGGPLTGLSAAWLLATSPIFLFMVVQPMSDVPVAAAWAVVVWCLLRGTVGGAIGAGLAATVAVLIRPNLFPMAMVIFFWLAASSWRAGGANRANPLGQWFGFCAGLAPGIVTIAWLNSFWYGSPWRSGYGRLEDLLAWSNIQPNAHHYLGWLIQTQTPLVLLGLAAPCLPVARIWPVAAYRSVRVLFALLTCVVWVEYCAYTVFDAWFYLRFLLPTWPLIMVGVALLLRRVAQVGRPVMALVVMLLLLAVGLRTWRVAVESSAFDIKAGESKYAAVGAAVRTRTSADAVIFSEQHSGSIRYYAGRMTLTYNNFDPEWLDRSVAWLDAHDAHPYAVLEEWEVKDFREHFAGRSAIGRLTMNPVLEYRGTGAPIYLFDLLRSGPQGAIERIADPSGVRGCPEPAPPMRFRLRD
jgi:hypothetical protein